MHQVIGEPLNYHRDADGDYYDPARLIAWLEAKYARHREEEDLYAAEMLRWFVGLTPAASGLSADARSNDTTTGGLKERPEPALTDERINDLFQQYGTGRLVGFAAALRAALSHRSTEEPADPEGARDRHAAAAAALLGPGYRLKGGE